MRLIFFLLFPIFLSAQITRSYGVIEISGFPISSTTGPKFAYNPADSSFYRWSHGSTWVKVIEPSIISAGWGIIKTGLTYLVDSSKVASRYYVSTSPTTIAANYAAVSNGTNLIARNLFDNNTYAGVISRPWKFGEYTTAGLPTGVTGYTVYNTTINGIGWYDGTRWNYVPKADRSAFTDTYIPFTNSSGQFTESNSLKWDNTLKYFYINTPAPPSPAYHLNITSSGTISQRWLGMYNSSNIIQCAFTSDGSGNGAVHAYNNVGTLQGKFSSGDLSFLVGKMVFGNTVIASGSDFLVQLRQTDIGLNARINIGGSGGGFPGVGYNVNFSASSNTYTRKGTGVAYFIDFGSNSRFSMKTAPSAAAASTITWAEPFAINLATNFIGINQTSPQRQLHVTGEARITDLTTDTPTRIVGADADGDLGAITVSTGLDLTSGVLTATGASTWLKTELEASRDVTIAGGSSTDFRIQTTRIQFDGKTKIGSDSSFIHDPAVDTTRILGTSMFGKASTLGTSATSGYPFIFRNPSSSSTYMLIESGRTSPTGGAAGLRLLPSGNFTSIIEYGMSTASGLQFVDKGTNKINLQIGSSQFVTGNRRTVIVGSDDPTQWGANGTFVIYDTITTGKAMFLAKKVTSSSTPLAMFSSAENDRFTFNDDGTTRFHVYGTSATTAATLGKTESGYLASFATDGTVLSRAISSLSNGIYSSSGTLANHTTRALIPSTGNLLFSQKYNSNADSAYIQVINNLDGNREIRGGLTDTASTGFSKFRFYQDEPNEEMGWEILTSDGTGTTAVGGQGGNLSLYADAAGTVEMRGQEIRLNNGEVLMNQYGQGNMKYSDLGATDSKFVAKFSDGGKILDYYLARDTFIEDVTLFSVGTLMNDCQELTIVSSMTATAPSHQEIRFPDAGDHLRGKKIIVYQKKKEAGIYVPQIKVVGGVSRLYFTTNPAVGGTDPSDQSVLSIDDSTWSDHGTTFEFTCLKIDTSNYRWVLKQR